MAADKKFDLGEYVEVKDRIKLFYELFGQGRLQTGEVRLSTEPDGVPRVMVQALAYRNPDDLQPGIGWSWMALPGTTSYTKGSELENTETSAWGRAIASLGILVDRSIASAQEVANKTGGASRPPDRPELERRADGLTGTVTVGKPPVDMHLRQTPDGPAWGFKLKSGNSGYQALAVGDLADSLSQVGDITGQTVTVWGRIEMVAWEKDGKAMPPYARIAIERLGTPDFVLPADVPAEAPSLPLLPDDYDRWLTTVTKVLVDLTCYPA